LIKLKAEIIGITKELLEENESNITDIKKNSIFAAATIMTVTMKQHSKRSNDRRN